MADSEGNENWFKNDDSEETAARQEMNPTGDRQPEKKVEWTASEFVERHKSAGWYLILALVVVVVAGVVFFSGRDYVAVGAVAAIGIIFGIIGARKPRTLNYKLDSSGLSIGEKFYPYRHFKAFSLAHEGAAESINLLPLRRFMPVMKVYFDPATEDKVTGVIGDYLPLDTHKLDAIDKFLHKIRF